MIPAMIVLIVSAILTSLAVERRLRKRGVEIDDLSLMSRIGAWSYKKDMTSNERWALFLVPMACATATVTVFEGIVFPLLSYYEIF